MYYYQPRTLKLLTLLLLFSLSLANLYASVTKENLNKNYKIIAYYPEWGIYKSHNYYLPSSVPFEKITHLHYAFATIKDGKIAHFDKYAAVEIAHGEDSNSSNRGNLGQFKKLKKNYPHLSLIISIGGWTQSGNFHDVAASQYARDRFASSVVQYLRKYDMDGIDIDWEFPGFYRAANIADNPFDQGTPKADKSEKETYTLLLQNLRKHLDIASKEDKKYYQLSVAVSPIPSHIELTEPEKYEKYIDYITLMTYDMHGPWDSTSNHQTALYTHPCAFDEMNIDTVVKRFISLGINPKKLNIGTPFFARGWREVNNSKYAPKWLDSLYKSIKCWIVHDTSLSQSEGLFRVANGGVKGLWDSGTAYTGIHPYYHIVKLEQDKEYKKYYDQTASATYLYNKTKAEMYSYEDRQSLLKKTEYIKEHHLGGIAIWEITGDTAQNSNQNLLNLLYNRLLLNFINK